MRHRDTEATENCTENALPFVALSPCLCSLCLCVAFVFGPVAHAQESNPASLYGKDSTQGVYVRDSAVAVEKFTLAERMEHLKEWAKSADVYQEILNNYADRVVPSQVDKDDRIYQYTSVGSAVQERLSKWPQEGLDVYRARFENDAATLMQSKPDDPATLHRVMSLYFVTDAAKQAGMKLIDVLTESGDFAAAAWIGDRLLNWHPNIAVERPVILFRTAVAYHLAGNEALAKERAETLKKDHPAATGTVRGKDAVLAESIDKELTAVAASVAQLSAVAESSWPTVYGSPDRARIPASGGYGGAKIFSIELAKQSLRGSGPGVNGAGTDRATIDAYNKRDRANGAMTGVMPCIDRGEMFFQDNANVYAVGIDSGLPLPGWAATYDGDRNGRYAISAWPSPRNVQNTVTLTDDAVFAVMGQPDLFLQATAAYFGRRDTRLVCLDRRTGKEKWVVRPQSLNVTARAPGAAGAGAGGADDKPQDPNNARPDKLDRRSLQQLDLAGSPLVVGDNVYVAARSGSTMQFEDCYVLCFDRDSGRFNWACYIASANPRNMMMWDADTAGGAPNGISHLAYSSGRLYVLSNLGALAAVDAYDGTIVWLNIYPRNVATDTNRALMRFRGAWNRGGGGGDPSQTSGKPWMANPVIVAEGRCFALPADGRDLVIYDAGTGVEVKRIPQQMFDDLSMLLAVQAEKLVVANGKQVFFIDWQNFDPKKAREDNLIWATTEFPTRDRDRNNPAAAAAARRAGRPMPAAGAANPDAILGRPFVTTEAVLVPTYKGIVKVSMKNGQALETYPSGGRAWDETEEGPGNVIALQDHMVIATATRVNVYTDMNVARSKLDREVAAAPDDPDPRLRYAEVMFVAGDINLAIAKLDEAVKVTAAMNPAASGAARERIFSNAMTFAQKLSRDSKGETVTDDQLVQTINGLYDRAAAAATSAQQQVNYRIARARFARTTKDSATELTLLQEILAEPQYRAIAVAPEGEGATAPPSPAALAASRQIDDLIKRDPSAYEPVQQAAATAMDEAKASNDPNKLLNVAQVYPNAKVAPQALLAAANAYEAADNHRQAAQLLRQLYFRYPQSADKLAVVESLARNYLAMSNYVEVAAARLAQAAKLDASAKLTKPMKLPDGQVIQDITFADALKVVRKFHDQVTAKALPELKLPQQAAPGQQMRKPFVAAAEHDAVVQNVAALVAALRDFVRTDRVVTFTPNVGVSVYEVGKTEPIFSSNAIAEQPTNCAWLGDNLLVWAGGRIVLLKGNKDEQVWSNGLKAISMVDVATADDASDAAAGDADGDGIADAQQIQINGRVIPGGGQVRVVRGPNGQVLVIQGGQRLLLQGNGQVQVLGGPGAVNMPVAAAGGPEQIWVVRLVADRAIVGTTSGRVIAIDLADGKTLWQTRLGDRVIDRLLASDDFVVATVNDGSALRLTVMDTFSGQTLQKRDFNNDGTGLVNLALSPDGKLIYVTADQLSCKDLFEPGDLSKPTFVVTTRRTDGNPLFLGAIQPDQLAIADGRALVVSDGGQFVRVYSLETGKPLQPVAANGNRVDVDGGLQTKSSDWKVQLLMVGPRVYVWSPRTVISYNLERLSDTWEPPSRTNSAFAIRDVAAAKDFLLVIDEPVGARRRGFNRGVVPPGAGGPAPVGGATSPPLLKLRAFSRATVEGGGESGVLAHEFELRDAAGVNAWQVVDGGFYYLTADKKLHFLKGAASD